MNSYGLKVTSPYNESIVKKIYNAFGDIILTDAGVYEIYCTSDTFIHHNFLNNILHIKCFSEEDDIEINIRASGEAKRDEVVDIYHEIIANNKNVISKINTKGIAYDNSKIIYRSSLTANKNSTGRGSQAAKFIFQSDEAEIDSEPSLNIVSSEFPTNHAIGISGIDKYKVWYLSNRGFDQKEAEREIIEGFLN